MSLLRDLLVFLLGNGVGTVTPMAVLAPPFGISDFQYEYVFRIIHILRAGNPTGIS